jgi:DNA repair protein RecO (recombination protein O)
MQWQDQAIIIGVKRHGETSVIAEVMTRGRGRHLGLVRGGRSRSMQPVLQPGNEVELTWRARLDEHLGEYRLEPLKLRAARLMETATAVYGVQAMGALLRLLPERDPHPHLFEALEVILDNLHSPADAGELFVRFELAVLNDLGYGLDLAECAATGVRADLANLTAAFRLTSFFLHRHVYEPRGIEAGAAREGFVQAALKALKASSKPPGEMSA